MKRYRSPSSLGLHRIACLALYRALLRPISYLPIALPHRRYLERYIKKTFRCNRNISSPYHIIEALDVGYAGEEVLRRSADGDAASTSRIQKLLLSLDKPEPSLRKPSFRRIGDLIPERPQKKHSPRAPWPGATPVLERPYLEISGPRHVPKLVNAGSNPMLRFKKPQSPYLSGLIRDKINTKQRRYSRLEELEADLQLSRMEDDWERSMGLEAGQGIDEPSWAASLLDERRELNVLLKAEERKKRELSLKMQEIVDRERELWEQERQERRKAKQLERMAPEAGATS